MRISKHRRMISQLILILFLSTVSLSFFPLVQAQDTVDISPGKFDYKLGKGFPREDRVKIDYPKSTIIIDSNGELAFNVSLTTFNYTDRTKVTSIIKDVTIYIPPEFTVNNGITSVWTSFTNNYSPSSVSLSTALSLDPIAPGWSVLTIFNLNITNFQEDVENRIFIENRTQYIRVFNVTSPSIVGRYFFKIFIRTGGYTYSIGSNNFPTLVVKAALNPAYISGVVRYGGSDLPNLYGQPLDSTVHPDGTVLLPYGYGGRVYAEGLTADGWKVYAQSYFNSTAKGKYTLYGIAPATYNITVQAAGYPPQRFIEVITVAQGQSLENLDFYVLEGTNVTGIIYSKHGFEEVQWGVTYDLVIPPPFNVKDKVIRVDLTDLDENIIASSPLRLYVSSALDFRPRYTLDPKSTSFHFTLRREVSFDGHIPQDYANYTSGISSGDYYVKAYVAGYVQIDPSVVHVNNNTREVETIIDLQRSSYFEVTVHFKHRQGHLKPKPTYIGGYLYFEVLDAVGAVIGFNVSYVPEGSETFTMQVRGIDIWNRLIFPDSKLTAWAYSHDRGLLPGTYTINALFVNQTVDFIAINALIVASPELRMAYPTTTEPLLAAFPSEMLELTNRQTPLYFQLDMIKATTGGFCDSATELSFELVQGGGFNITLYPVDWQTPSINREWAHPYSPIRVDIYTPEGDVIGSINSIQPIGKSLTISNLFPQIIVLEDGTIYSSGAIGLKTGSYILKIHTHGYLEDPNISQTIIPVTLGDISDARVNLLRGATIDLTFIFKTEHMFDPINNHLEYARPINNIDATPLRVEVFNEYGEFVAANVTYVDNCSFSIQILLDGFERYYGNPRNLWTNFYDTTDAERRDDSGIDEGLYKVRVTLAGYLQAEVLQILIDSGRVNSRPTISVTQSLERLGYLRGDVIWVNWCGRGYPLSWATITAYSIEGEEGYTFSLDGFYEIWLPSNDYDFGLRHPGFKEKYFEMGLRIGPGSVTTINFIMN